MKIFPAIIIPCLLLLDTCGYPDAASEKMATDPSTKSITKIDFEKEVMPVLVAHCSPCHFTGGKMYERLPFDKEATLVNNVDKILKRVEKDEKKVIVKDFLLQIKGNKASIK